MCPRSEERAKRSSICVAMTICRSEFSKGSEMGGIRVYIFGGGDCDCEFYPLAETGTVDFAERRHAVQRWGRVGAVYVRL